jgi:hypothetical protein
MVMAVKKQHEVAQPPSLSDKIRLVANKIRALDADCKEVIELYLDVEKATYPTLPRPNLEMLLMSKYRHPWFAILGLEEQLKE